MDFINHLHDLISCSVSLQLLITAKGIAVGLSGSLAIISSLVDSAVDLVSGVIIWYTSRAMKKTDIYHYPIGKIMPTDYRLILTANVYPALNLLFLTATGPQPVAYSNMCLFADVLCVC